MKIKSKTEEDWGFTVGACLHANDTGEINDIRLQADSHREQPALLTIGLRF